jgi:hypothetical protein
MEYKFINTVTESTSLEVGKRLQQSTKRVQHVQHGRIIFVDTPALPDPEKPSTPQLEVLRMEKEITECLKRRCVPEIWIRTPPHKFLS